MNVNLIVDRSVYGIHLLGELYGCAAGAELTHAEPLQAMCVKASLKAGLTVVGSTFHQFEPFGATGVVLLAESHVAVHTWPEQKCVNIDVFVCNRSADNTSKAHELLRLISDLMRPTHSRLRTVQRGQSSGGLNG